MKHRCCKLGDGSNPVTEDASDLRDQFHSAIAKLLDEVMCDPVLGSDTGLSNAAIAAQSAAGKVQQRLDSVPSAKNAHEERVLTDELQKVEAELDTAAIEFLRRSVNSISADTAKAALELLNAIPKAVSEKHDLSGVRARLDIILLKEKKSGVRLELPK